MLTANHDLMAVLLGLLPGLPALAALWNGLLSGRLRERAVAAAAVGSVGIALVLALGFLAQMLNAVPGERIVSCTLYQWMSGEHYRISVGLILDPLSMTMALVILFVGFLIHLYSVAYMKGDPGYRRFFIYLNLFIFFMLILVMADNLVLTFFGWEGVGLCSYLLIGFWHEKKPACDAGRKAFVVNRIGDFGFLLGILLILVTFQTVDYQELNRLAQEGGAVPTAVHTVIPLLLFMGAMGKSAQFPLHVWLPDAMEGPTPVSALIHAATMVNAGVYLMCRISPLLSQVPFVLGVIAAVGLVTAVYAALSALGQTDIKRVLAYSTVSQIGFMFVAVGCGIYAAGIFHLVTHGIFKGLLFLGAGAVIHALNGEQDLGRMGGLLGRLPAASLAFLAGLLALAGIFPLSGFFSKDAILWGSLERFGISWWLAAFFGALITAVYCGKLFGVFFGERRDGGHLHKPGLLMVGPLAILAVCSLAAGLLGLPMFTADTAIARFLGASAVATHTTPASAHQLEVAVTLVQTLVVSSVLAGAVYLFIRRRSRMDSLNERYPHAAAGLAAGFGMDRMNEVLLVRPIKAMARISARVIDIGIIDGAVDGVGSGSIAAGRLMAALQTGKLHHYALSMITGVALFVMLVLYFTLGS